MNEKMTDTWMGVKMSGKIPVLTSEDMRKAGAEAGEALKNMEADLGSAEASKVREVFMEDIHSIALAAMKVIEQRLKEDHGIVLTDGQDDFIYIPMEEAIEKICKYPDYRSHM